MKWSEVTEGEGEWREFRMWARQTSRIRVDRMLGLQTPERRTFYWRESPALLIIPKYALLLFISSSLADHTGLVLKNIFTNLIRQPNTPGKLL